MTMPRADYVFKEDDKIIVIGKADEILRLDDSI